MCLEKIVKIIYFTLKWFDLDIMPSKCSEINTVSQNNSDKCHPEQISICALIPFYLSDMLCAIGFFVCCIRDGFYGLH